METYVKRCRLLFGIAPSNGLWFVNGKAGLLGRQPAQRLNLQAEKASPPAPEPHGSKACKMVFLDLTL